MLSRKNVESDKFYDVDATSSSSDNEEDETKLMPRYVEDAEEEEEEDNEGDEVEEEEEEEDFAVANSSENEEAETKRLLPIMSSKKKPPPPHPVTKTPHSSTKKRENMLSSAKSAKLLGILQTNNLGNRLLVQKPSSQVFASAPSALVAAAASSASAPTAKQLKAVTHKNSVLEQELAQARAELQRLTADLRKERKTHKNTLKAAKEEIATFAQKTMNEQEQKFIQEQEQRVALEVTYQLILTQCIHAFWEGKSGDELRKAAFVKFLENVESREHLAKLVEERFERDDSLQMVVRLWQHPLKIMDPSGEIIKENIEHLCAEHFDNNNKLKTYRDQQQQQQK